MKFSSLVDEYRFALMLPNGTREPAGEKNPFWNATDACCNFQGSAVDDSNYLLGLIETAKKTHNIDPARVYLVGHSNGGFMSYRMAADHPQVIAAIVSLAGASALTLSAGKATHAVGILQIHGTDDATVKYAGGAIRGNHYPGAVQTAELWAQRNSGGIVNRAVGYRLDLDASIEGFETSVQQFDTDNTVELWTINGGSHVPPLSDTFSRAVIEWLFAHSKP